MTSSLQSLSDLPPEFAARINRACEDFETDYQKPPRNGPRPRIEDYLGGADGLERRGLLYHLVQMDLELRRKASEVPAMTDYAVRFPRDAEVISRAFANALTAPVAPALIPDEVPAVPGFEVRGRLGDGGTGDVYLAYDLNLKREVALKLIRCGWGGRGARERAGEEAVALARLQDPQVVTVYDVDEYQGRPYLSLEFVRGGSLADRLKGVPQPPRDVATLVETLALTMHRIHARGMVHRDLKPANILLDDKAGLRLSEVAPKVTDFGLVKHLDAGGGRSVSGMVLGTPSYMAPEQARGENDKVDHRADVYALGAILYECLTGRPPFRAATTLETLMQVVSDEPAPVRRLNPAVDEGLAFICMKCLAKDPAGRYHSAAALAADLRLWIDGDFIVPRSVLRWLLRPLNRPFRDEEYPSRYAWNLRGEAATSLLSHVGLAGLLLAGQPGQVLWVWLLLTLYAASWVNWWCLLDRRTLNTMERDVVMLWIAADIADLILFGLHCPLWGTAAPADVVAVYPTWAVVHGLIFFVEGHFCWGRLYLVGSLYFAAAVLLSLAGAWAPVAYGLLHSGAFVWLSCQTSPNEPRKRVPADPPPR